VSHQPERKEKDCLNCGTLVQGRYCHQCGQENIVTHQNFWALTRHFIYDLFHFDGKFFDTIKYFFTRPGYVARQYAEGKRMSFLDPIRIYLFTSAIFFLVFFSMKGLNIGEDLENEPISSRQRAQLSDFYQEQLKQKPGDSVLAQRIRLLNDTTIRLTLDTLGWRRDLAQSMTINGRRYRSVAEFDSVQKVLPKDSQLNFFERYFMRKAMQSNLKYGSEKQGIKVFIDQLLHKLPYMLFLSLPFFAGILKLLYIRRKNFYYSDHAVFTLYHYVFSFILLLLIMLVSELGDRLRWGFAETIIVVLSLIWPVYLFIEMKNFYRQSKRKTFVKFILLNILGFLLMMLLFTLFILLSIFQS
jgi:hypothetical protein